MTSQPAPAMVAVIGPVPPELLAAWISHYQQLGITRFHLAFHFPDHVGVLAREHLLQTCRQHGITPGEISTGPWHEDTNTLLRDRQREAAGPGWHLIADSDEFHTYPAPLGQVLGQAQRSGTGTVGGLFLDRITANGALTACDWHKGLDASYPLGGFLTHRLLRGDPRKIVLAHSSIAVASGNHRAPDHRPANQPPVVVHHFKWRAGVISDLERRVSNFTNGTWRSASPAVASEARRLLGHLERHDGMIALDQALMPFRSVSLRQLPDWWAAEATRLVATWRPPRHQKEPGATISSPSP
jgi:hypothetical protein